MNNRYNTIDFFKILFCFGVIFGHTYCIFYQKAWVDCYGIEMTQIHNIFTDGFFMCSGIFLARSVEKLRCFVDFSKDDLIIKITKSRVSRLWGAYMFSGVLWLVYKMIFEADELKGYIWGLWTYPLFISGINTIPALGITWYVSALFWMGLVITALLVYIPEVSKRAALPILIFVTYSFMYARYYSDNLDAFPIVADFISAGLIRALCVISIGVELFYIANCLAVDSIGNIAKKHKIVIALVEIISSCILVLVAIMPGLDNKSFLIYPSFGALCIIFINHWEVVFDFANNKVCSVLIHRCIKYTYMIYLSHTLLLEFLNKTIEVTIRARYFYLLMLLASIAFGVICYWGEYFLHRRLSNKLSINV